MHVTSASRRWVLLGASAALLVALGTAQVSAGRRAASDAPALPTAVVENLVSQTPSVSADGRLVAYAGAPSSPTDQRTSTVWLKDRADGSVIELTTQPTDIRVGNSVWPVVSADGCSVTVVTEFAYDLFRDDDAGTRWDVYRQVLPLCGGIPG